MRAFNVLITIYDYIRPLIDIGILSFVLYKAYEIITNTNSVQLIKAAILLGTSYVIVVLLDLTTLQWIFSVIAPGLIMAFAIVFQPEFRKILLRLGQTEWFAHGKRIRRTYVDRVLTAAEILASQKRGMLIVFMGKTKLDDILKGGTPLNADISSDLLLTIFAYNTAFHDGACIIKETKLISAGCFLPLSQNYDINKIFGTRHRAALGLSEVSDSTVLVVSEETGSMSLAYDGQLHYDLTIPQITRILESRLEISSDDKNIEDEIDENK